jgi:hypothetical protein
LRDIKSVHRSPTDYHNFEQLFANIDHAEKHDIEIVRVAVLWYNDAFPIQMARKSNSSHGDYVSNAAMPDKLFVIGQGQKGLDRNRALAVWKPDVTALVNGTFVLAGPPQNRRKILFHGGILLVKADHPQAQHDAGSLQQGANYPSRFYHVHKKELDNLNFDLRTHRKTLDWLRDVRARKALDPTCPIIATELTRGGLRSTPSFWEDPALCFDVCQQVGPMTEHSEATGMGGLFLQAFLTEQTPVGQTRFQQALSQQPRPHHLSVVPVPKLSAKSKKLQQGMMDILYNMQIIPFALSSSFLSLPPKKKERGKVAAPLQLTAKFTDEALAKYREKPDAASGILTAAIALACSQKQLFAKIRSSGSFEEDKRSLDLLDQAVLSGRRALQAVYPERCKIPNFFHGLVYREAVSNYGVPIGLNLCREEGTHSKFKVLFFSLLSPFLF